jgi:hypothetical protein
MGLLCPVVKIMMVLVQNIAQQDTNMPLYLYPPSEFDAIFIKSNSQKYVLEIYDTNYSADE